MSCQNGLQHWRQGKGSAYISNLLTQLRILGPFHRRQLPVVDIIPPPADSAADSLAAERGVAVPETPPRERESPDGALDEREENLHKGEYY